MYDFGPPANSKIENNSKLSFSLKVGTKQHRIGGSWDRSHMNKGGPGGAALQLFTNVEIPCAHTAPMVWASFEPSPFSKNKKKVKKERKVRGLENVPKAPTKWVYHQVAWTRRAERHAGDSKHTNDQPHINTCTYLSCRTYQPAVASVLRNSCVRLAGRSKIVQDTPNSWRPCSYSCATVEGRGERAA